MDRQNEAADQSSSGPVDQATLALFFVALPEPIPIPHGTVLSFDFENQVPCLLGMNRQPSPRVPPIPGSESGQLFASIKFWQVKATTDYYLRQAEAVQKVICVVQGGTLSAAPEPWAATITVVELVTLAATIGAGPASDPFQRCLTCLTDVIDAYRVAEKAIIPRISYEQLGPFVMTYQRSMMEPYEWLGPRALQLDHSNIKVANPEELDGERLERMLKVLSGLRAGQPFSGWAALCRDRDYAFHVAGDYRATVIQAALAVEVLIMSVLTCLLWEKTFPNAPSDADLDVAAGILHGKDARHLRAELGKRIGGDWGSHKAPSTVWQKCGANLRNRVAHLGYCPTRDEAAHAITSAIELDQLIRKQLAVTCAEHHRTTAMLLGEPGLVRLGAMTKEMRKRLDQSASEPDWVRSYLRWRQKLADRDAFSG